MKRQALSVPPSLLIKYVKDKSQKFVLPLIFLPTRTADATALHFCKVKLSVQLDEFHRISYETLYVPLVCAVRMSRQPLLLQFVYIFQFHIILCINFLKYWINSLWQFVY